MLFHARKGAMQKQRLLRLVDNMTKSGLGAPFNSLLEKISSFLKKKMYFDAVVAEKRYDGIDISSIMVGDIVKGETENINIEEVTAITDLMFQRDSVGVVTSVSSKGIDIDGDYHNHFFNS